MRIIATLSIGALVLSACTLPTDTLPGAAPAGPVSVTPVRWKENTPRSQRAADNAECIFAAVGLPPTAPEDELIRRQSEITESQNIAFVDRCMANKGYQVTDKPVCTETDIRSGTFVNGSEIDALPPLSQVRCMAPSVGGFVVV